MYKKHCGVEQLVARRAHNPKVAGSSPAPATKNRNSVRIVLSSNGRIPDFGSGRGGSNPPGTTTNRGGGVIGNMPDCHSGDCGFDPRASRDE